MNVIKRDGSVQKFDKEKIVNAILKAMKADGVTGKESIAQRIANDIESGATKDLTVEEIQDLVEDKLMASSLKSTARKYIRYRYERELLRKANTTDKSINELLNGSNEYWNDENGNKNAKLVTTQRDYIAGITSTDIARRFLFTKDVVDAHDSGIIHIHDMDYMAENTRTNCCLVNLEDMLQNGTMVNGVMIEKPHRFLTACTIATQIITAVSSSQYGGTTVTLTHLAPFVRDSYNRFLKKYREFGLSEEQCQKLAEIDTKREIKDGVQTFNYQVNSMSSTNGQAPFLSVNMDIGETKEYKKELAMIIEEFLRQRILGFKNRKGVYVTVAFPKLLYVLNEENMTEDSPYWYLTVLSAKTTAKRMVPDYISSKIMKKLKINKFGQGDCYPCMGCRSFLTPFNTNGNVSKALNYVEGEPKYYGRFNMGVCTINLPDVALSSHGDKDEFWRLMDERTELCHKALKTRVKRLENTVSDVAPILWQDGALARLEPGETLYPLVHNGYSTISLGYAGLYECVRFMGYKTHTDEAEGEEFALEVMKYLNDKCAKWRAEEDVAYSLYGTPIESTTYKFATSLKKRFGEDLFVKYEGKDRDFITNSYHVFVEEPIDPFEKIRIEAKFQQLSPGGAISYIETANMQSNIPAVLEVIKYIYDNIMYAELNTKSDYCQCCGYEGEIKIIDENNKLIWECPNCGNRDRSKLNIARRICGYLSNANSVNQGRMDEFRNRYVHLDNHELEGNPSEQN